jgi:acyl-CoA hydrolase
MTTSIWYADGLHAPTIAPRAAAQLAGVAPGEELEVTLGLYLERHPWFDEPDFSARSVMVGYGLASAAARGAVQALPVRISAVPALIESAPPDVAVIGAVRRGDGFAVASAGGWACALARAAARVVLEIDEGGFDFGSEQVEGNVVATTPRPAPPAPLRPRPPDDVDRAIADRVARLLPVDATLEVGPGAVGEAVLDAVDRPVKIWSGLITDSVAELRRRDLLVGPAIGTYVWGGPPVEQLAIEGLVRLEPSRVTHDITALSAIPRFVACNSALQIGLDGAVNLERVGGRTISSIGGHADFSLGASRSPGGISIVALRSTTAGGDSAIVASVEVVSTARSDVQVVVTEHGVADLRGLDDRRRRRAIAAVAAPAHREALRPAVDLD